LFKLLAGRAWPVRAHRETRGRCLRPIVAATALATSLAGCQTVGPSRGTVEKAAAEAAIPGLQIIDLNQQAALTSESVALAPDTFAEALGGAEPVGTKVGIGDTLEVTIWEASPPALFGTPNLDPGVGMPIQGSRPNTFPGFMVGPSGTISIPFAGQVPVAGRTVNEIQRDIVRRLQGRAHLPQVIVRIAQNVTSTVSVLGDVKQPMQVPLTPHGERVLDAIAQAGGTNQALDRMTVQITRGDIVRSMAAKDIITDPSNNVVLKSGDVVTVSYQPYSFTVLGAAGKNEEVPFEGVGITLSQALGRVGGLNPDQADPKGVFIFRWEKPVAGLGAAGHANESGAIPVIYRVDMQQPETYLAAQKFAMRDGDVLYVSNSSVAELRRFIGVIASSMVPFATVRNIAR
jgi:polysaccharide biosynthesis/export protein